MANYKVNELNVNHSVVLLTEGEITQKYNEKDCWKILIPQGFQTIESALQYISQQESTLPNIIYLRKWRGIVSQTRAYREEQSCIKDFFKN